MRAARVRPLVMMVALALMLSACEAKDDTQSSAGEQAPAQSAAAAMVEQCVEGLAKLTHLSWALIQKPDATGQVELYAEAELLAEQVGMRPEDGFSGRRLAGAAQTGAASAHGPMSVSGNERYLRDSCEDAMVAYGALNQDAIDQLNQEGKYGPPSLRRTIPTNAPMASTPEEIACSDRLRVLYVRFLDGEIKPEQFEELAANPQDAQIIIDAYSAHEAGEISSADVSTLREMGCIEAY